MAVTITWGTKVINIPKSDLTVVQLTPTEIYSMDLNWLHLTLKDLEDGEEGMAYLDTHRHNTEVSLGGVIYARVVEIINGYTITFEDGQYAVNVIGGNSNVSDVVNVNQVSVRSANSAGLTSPVSATDIANAVWEEIASNHLTAGTTGKALSDAGSAGNPWSSPLAGNSNPGTFGELVSKKLLTLAAFLGLK